jgi:hypothetical protein
MATLAVMGEHGQASLEYLVATLAVGGLLALGSTFVPGSEVGQAVVRQMARAICVVGAGDCEEDRRPCVVATSRKGDSMHVNLAVFRIGRDSAVLREERSDGTVAVTLLSDLSGGLDLGLGADVKVSAGKRALLVGGELRAAALAHHGSASTWVLPSSAAADRLMKRLGSQPRRMTPSRGSAPAPVKADLPAPGETMSDTAFSVTFDGGGGAGPAHGTFTLGSTDFFGSRIDAATGRRTAFMRRRNALAGTVSLTGGLVKGGGGTGDASHDEVYAVTVDRDGRPVDLAIVEDGAYRVNADLPAQLAPVAGQLGVPTQGGRLYETETHLDLTDSLNLAAARDFLEQVRSPKPHFGRVVRVSQALRDRLDAAGTVQARTYALDASSLGAAGHAAVGLKVGGGYERSSDSARLLAAMSRGPGGAWTSRDDCLSGLRA